MNTMIRRLVDPARCRMSLSDTKLVLNRIECSHYILDRQLTNVSDQRQIRNLCEKAINITKDGRLYKSWTPRFYLPDSIEEFVTIESDNLSISVESVVYEPTDTNDDVIVDILITE